MEFPEALKSILTQNFTFVIWRENSVLGYINEGGGTKGLDGILIDQAGLLWVSF